jgi:phenylpyruvate tautomerase PptA (4-oxalocrotonate tautomerase family)
MPLVKIEVAEGFSLEVLLKMKELIMNAVVETLELPADDRNVRLMEYKPMFFEMKLPYQLLIEITMFAGRSKNTKIKLYKTITNSLEYNGLIDKASVFIVLNELPLENWGVCGGIPADEIKLNFKVEL